MKIAKKGLLLILLLIALHSFTQTSAIRFDASTIKGSKGYFRVGKTPDGQWWFIDPDGAPFYYRGIWAVNQAGTAGGRRANPGPYAETIDKKYGYQVSPDQFVKASIEKINSLGFNALGAWATEDFFNKGIPFTEIIEFFKEGPFLPAVKGTKALPDIFNPEWLVSINRKTRAYC